MRHRAPLAALFTAATLGLSLALGADAAACPPSRDPVEFGQPPPHATLLQRANDLELHAGALELEATHLTREAAELSLRAFSLRREAASWGKKEGAPLLALAMSLESDAASVRAAATATRLKAAQARAQAMELRRLARRPPGWRPRPTVATIF